MKKEIAIDLNAIIESSQDDNLDLQTAKIIVRNILFLYRLKFHENFGTKTDTVVDTINRILSETYPVFGRRLSKLTMSIRVSEEHQRELFTDIFNAYEIPVLLSPTTEERDFFDQLAGTRYESDVSGLAVGVFDFLKKERALK